MDYRDLVKLVPRTIRGPFSEKLIDILLKSDEAEIPPSLAKTILHYWQRDQLDSEAGLTNLMKAAAEADPVNTAAVIDDFGLKKLKMALSPIEG